MIDLNKKLLNEIEIIAESYGVTTNDYLNHLMLTSVKEEKKIRSDELKCKELINDKEKEERTNKIKQAQLIREVKKKLSDNETKQTI